MPVLDEALPSARRKATDLDMDVHFGPGPVEEWVAVAGGGFVRATYDLPALLFDTDLLHLYSLLIAEDCRNLVERQQADRPAFLAYLKDVLNMEKLSDRQLLANALARGQRQGMFDGPDKKAAKL